MSLASGHLGELRPPQVQGAQRPDRHRQALPRRLDAPSTSRAAVRGRVKDPGSAEASYYVWVDWFDTFGLGKNVPIAMGNLNELDLALVDGKFIKMRVPYPMGLFAKNVDGRIDDPNAGWKGRALWSTSGTRTMYHLEGGKGTGRRRSRSSFAPIRWRVSGRNENVPRTRKGGTASVPNGF